MCIHYKSAKIYNLRTHWTHVPGSIKIGEPLKVVQGLVALADIHINKI